ncbi:MAG: DNA alkylation repair protein [Pseudomonadota bacterium]
MAAALSKDSSAADIIAHMRAIATPEAIASKQRYGIVTDRCIGVMHGVQRDIAKTVGKNHQRAAELWQSRITECQLVGAFTADPAAFTRELAHQWANDFDSWDMVDGCGDLYAQSPDWEVLIDDFINDPREYAKRMAFVIMTYASIKRKKLPDEAFIPFIALCAREAGDERKYVHKGISWALRSIGKRSPFLREHVLEICAQLLQSEGKIECALARETIRDLNSASTRRRMAKKA